MFESIEQLINGMTTQVFSLVIQVIATTAVALYLKDLSSRLTNFIKIKVSDFGRGTKVEIDGKIGFITRVSFNQVEIRLDDQSVMIVPVDRFLKMPKVIYTNIPDRDPKK